MNKTLTESIYDLANQIVESNFEYSNVSQDEIDAYRDGLIKGMEEMYEIMFNTTEDFIKETFEDGFDKDGSHHVISKDSIQMDELIENYKKETFNDEIYK